MIDGQARTSPYSFARYRFLISKKTAFGPRHSILIGLPLGVLHFIDLSGRSKRSYRTRRLFWILWQAVAEERVKVRNAEIRKGSTRQRSPRSMVFLPMTLKQTAVASRPNESTCTAPISRTFERRRKGGRFFLGTPPIGATLNIGEPQVEARYLPGPPLSSISFS